jgi:hypothetical protein
MYVIVVVVVAFAAVLLAMRTLDRAMGAGASQRLAASRPPMPRPPLQRPAATRPPIGPDDDPEFLGELRRRIHRGDA